MNEKEKRVKRKSNSLNEENSLMDTTNEGNREGRRRRKKKKPILPIIMIILFFVIVLGTAAIYSYLQSFSNHSVDISQSKQDDGSSGSKESGEIKDSVNFLVVGVDEGSGDENDKNDPRRTDTMIVVHYNSKEKKYDLVSIPRDTKVKINGRDQKINAAHAIGQIPLAVETVEDLLNIKIDHYVKIDTIAFRQFIDAIGGIDVIVDRNMNYDDSSQNLHIHLNKSTEPQRLNGKQAEGFVRWRKNNDGTGYADGDLGRIKHMQGFFGEVINKIQSPTIIPKIPNILSIFPKYIETDLNANDILKYATSVAKIPKESIKYHTIGGEDKYINEISYYLFDKSKNGEIDAIFKDMPAGSANIDVSNVRIKIANGSGKTGLASDFGKYISKFGFANYDLADANRTTTSKIIIYGLDKEVGEYIKKQFGINNLEISTKYNELYEVEVILGEDRDYIKPQ
jgi:LCP family protein required for cell wall assembly